MMLTRKNINHIEKIGGFLCAGIGILSGLVFMFRCVGPVVGSGAYLFLTACIALCVGVALYNRQLALQTALEKFKQSPKPVLITGIAVVGILCLAFMFGTGGNDPQRVVKKFVAALKKGDYTTAGKISTPETIQMLTRGGDQIKNRMQMVGKIKSCKLISINEDYAVVRVTFENDNDPPDFELKKIDGKWRVHMRW
jgi:hypothetical protein